MNKDLTPIQFVTGHVRWEVGIFASEHKNGLKNVLISLVYPDKNIPVKQVIANILPDTLPSGFKLVVTAVVHMNLEEFAKSRKKKLFAYPSK